MSAAESETGWIAMKRRRPKESGWYLVISPAGRDTTRCKTLSWWEPGWGWRSTYNFGNGEKMPYPTHWMPLP